MSSGTESWWWITGWSNVFDLKIMIDLKYYRRICGQMLTLSEENLILTDPDGRVEEISRQWADELGKTREEAVGRPVWELLPEIEIFPLHEIKSGKGKEEEEIEEREFPARGQNKAGNRTNLSVQAVRDENGETIAFLVRTGSGPRFSESEHGLNETEEENLTLHEKMAAYEKKLILEILERCGYNYTEAAKQAGVHRSLLYKKTAKYRIRRREEE